MPSMCFFSFFFFSILILLVKYRNSFCDNEGWEIQGYHQISQVNLICNETFTFKEERINNDEEVEILLKDGVAITIGKVSLLISDAFWYDSFVISYAPYWYALKDRNNRNINVEVNLTYLMETQVYAEFASSWHSDSTIDMCCILFTCLEEHKLQPIMFIGCH